MKKILSLILSMTILFVCATSNNIVNANSVDGNFSIDAGANHSVLIKPDGSLWAWGFNKYGTLGDGTTNDSLLPIKIMDNVRDVQCGGYYNAAVKRDGSLWVWGQFGGNLTEQGRTPVKIMDNVKKIYVYSSFAAAIKTDNSLWTWGYNNDGQLGNGTYEYSSAPQKIMDNVKDVFGGEAYDNYAAAIKNDGTLWMWGNNSYGQFGNTSGSTNKPQQVMTNIKSIYRSSDSAYYCIAIKNDNSLWGWGTKSYSKDIYSPTKILDDILMVHGSKALKKDGTLWAWGSNQYGQIGNGTTIDCEYPIKIAENVKICVSNTAFIKNDGSLWTWGYNGLGLVGDGTSKDKYVPVKIMDNVVYASLFGSRGVAVKNDGSLWMWGDNMYGVLGDGTTKSRFSPVKIMNLYKGIIIEGENLIQPNIETVLKATRYDEDGNIAPEGGITWSCSNESVAQITPNGNSITVKGLKGGKATITATHSATGTTADFEIEVVSYVMGLFGGYTVLIDEELPIEYSVKQGEEYVHNDLDIDWEIEQEGSNKAVKIISDKEGPYVKTLTVKGLNVGECELVAKVNGTEIGRTKIEVLGDLAETIDNEKILRAKILVDNSQYKYYKNYNSVHQIYADESDLTTAIVKYSLDNYMNLFFKSIYEGKAPSELSATEFYEAMLIKLVNDKENVKVFGKAGDIMSDYILKYGKSLAKQGTKIDDKNRKQLKELCTDLCGDGMGDVGFIDTLLVAGKSIDTFFEEYARVYQMANCTNEQIKALKLIRSATDDKALKTACDNVIRCITNAQKDTANYAVSRGTHETAEGLREYAFEKCVGLLEDLSPVLAAANLANTISSPVNNILFKTDDLNADTIDLFALIIIEDALKDAMKSAESTFNSKPTAEKADDLMALADFYKNVQLQGCDIVDSTLEHVGEAKRNQSIAKKTTLAIIKELLDKDNDIDGWEIFNIMFGNKDENVENNRKTVASIRKLIDSADFYSTEGTDIAEYIREVKSTTPSDWAKAEINKAKNLNILPDYMQNNYQNNITRAEFCTLLTYLLEEQTGKSVDALIAEKGTPIKSPFEDTYYEYADYMYKLGIVNGVGDDKFEPLGEITREQAATMLMRAADVLGYDTANNGTSDSGVSSWAQSGVGFVTENGIMNGTGNGFEPQGKYTKEQAIATFVRMFENLK